MNKDQNIFFKKSVVVLVILLFASPVWAQKTEYYVVRPGDTLSKIANRYDTKWTEIYRANKNLIKDANEIEIGWKLRIPSTGTIAKHEASGEKVVRLVSGDSYAPFTDRKLPSDGMLTEIVELALKKMGTEYKLEFWGWQHGFDATVEGEFAATFPYTKTPERDKKFIYSEPLYEVLVRWFVKKDSPVNYTEPEDLNGLTVCKAEGYQILDVQAFLDKGVKLQLKRPKDIEDCFDMVKKGEADIVVVNEFTGWAIVKKLYGTKEDSRTLDEPYQSSPLCLLISKRYPERSSFVKNFNKALDELDKEGILEEIKKRHLKYYWMTH